MSNRQSQVARDSNDVGTESRRDRRRDRGVRQRAHGRRAARGLAVSLTCAGVLATMIAGAASSPSMAAETQLSCPFYVNQRLLGFLFAPVPGDLDLCAAWHLGTNLPTYPESTTVYEWPRCEDWVAAVNDPLNPEPLGRTLPDPLLLDTFLRSSQIYITQVGLVHYRIRFRFLVPRRAKIELYRPNWDGITEAQRVLLDRLFELVLVHEKGHKNILANLSQKFSFDGVRRARPRGDETYDEAAQRLAGTLYKQARLNLVQDDRVIEVKPWPGYDVQTSGGFKQSVFGGTDYPGLDRLCLPITSTFDTDDEGWTASGDAVSSDPTYHASGGNPGGFVEIVDQAIEGVWYWVAPQKYLGDRSGAYGTFLTFELKQSALDKPFSAVDVRIAGGGPTLAKRFNSPPGLDWTLYFLPLDVTGGWVVEATNAPATRQQIQSTLDSLSSLQIRGEYRTGADVGGLDNVAFGVPKE